MSAIEKSISHEKNRQIINKSRQRQHHFSKQSSPLSSAQQQLFFRILSEHTHRAPETVPAHHHLHSIGCRHSTEMSGMDDMNANAIQAYNLKTPLLFEAGCYLMILISHIQMNVTGASFTTPSEGFELIQQSQGNYA